uniref:Uncharacterized protein n=1 Tax=Octopus bimaculoides TaxID=37653 RepID=A0A0L8GMR9_OCTBM
MEGGWEFNQPTNYTSSMLLCVYAYIFQRIDIYYIYTNIYPRTRFKYKFVFIGISSVIHSHSDRLHTCLLHSPSCTADKYPFVTAVVHVDSQTTGSTFSMNSVLQL